ncbi:MAG: heavy-metal-associated domain-containing protein [Calditrichaeota bacterium]|nr:heavy-metal-associated domain-containing protein [Calditrichota bacterium]
MKKLIALALLLSVAAFAGDKKDQHKMDMSHPGHAMISVPTVQCDNCVKTITAAVKKVDGVKSIKIDLEKKVAHVNFDAKKVQVADIRNAIAAAGYDADDVKRVEKVYDALPKCCQSKR